MEEDRPELVRVKTLAQSGAPQPPPLLLPPSTFHSQDTHVQPTLSLAGAAITMLRGLPPAVPSPGLQWAGEEDGPTANSKHKP